MSDMGEVLVALVIGYGGGSLVTYALVRFGASLQMKRARFTPATANAPLAFMPATDGLPKLSKEIRRIVPSEPKQDDDVPENYTFPIAADDGTITREAVAARYLLRFVTMPTVSRENWTGEKRVYGQLLRIAEAHGWIQRANGKEWEWANDFRTLARRVMRLRDNRIILPTPASARARGWA